MYNRILKIIYIDFLLSNP